METQLPEQKRPWCRENHIYRIKINTLIEWRPRSAEVKGENFWAKGTKNVQPFQTGKEERQRKGTG